MGTSLGKPAQEKKRADCSDPALDVIPSAELLGLHQLAMAHS